MKDFEGRKMNELYKMKVGKKINERKRKNAAFWLGGKLDTDQRMKDNQWKKEFRLNEWMN